MKRFTEQLESKANAVRLRAAEKDDLRERLVSYMEYHPLPLPLKEQNSLAESSSFVTPVRLVHVNLWRVLQGSVATLGVLVFSISYLAERAVPGDMLYAVKVSINEEVRSTLTRSPYEKVVWETERLNRRIAEARLLASEGRLTDEVEAEVALAVKEHNDNARREIEVIKQTDKEEATLAIIQLETTIEVQATAFNNERIQAVALNTIDSGKTSLIASALADTQREDTDVVDDLPSYVRLTAHVERETTRAYELLQTVQDSATPDESSDINRRLEDINRAVLEANSTVVSDDIAARQALVAVLQRVQRLIVFMMNIDIRSEVTVEQIVPVTLTGEERNSALHKNANKILEKIEKIEAALVVTAVDKEIAEKIIPALEESKLIASTTKARLPLDVEELPSAEAEVGEALVIVDDAIVALGVDISSNLSPITLPETEAPIVTGSTTLSSSTATSSSAVIEDTSTSTIEVEA